MDEYIDDDFFDDEIQLPDDTSVDSWEEQISAILTTLTPREEKVIRLCFGLDDGRARTFEEVGKELGVPRKRAKRIAIKAAMKLRPPRSRRKRLKDYLD